jgi:glycine cleavage system H protein
MSDRPEGILYTKTHEWVRVDGDTATVGITDFAIEHLGDLVFVDLPDEGRSIETGDSVVEVESVKAVGEVYAPVTGEITEVNADLGNDQGPLASDPYGAGWLFKVKLTQDPGDNLMDLAAYEQQLEQAGETN